MRIRIKKIPDSLELTDFDKRTFVIGETIEVPARLATLLIVGGYAEPVMDRWETAPVMDRWEAADRDTARRKKP